MTPVPAPRHFIRLWCIFKPLWFLNILPKMHLLKVGWAFLFISVKSILLGISSAPPLRIPWGYCAFRFIVTSVHILIIHPRCIKVGPQWCTVFIANFRLCIMSAPTATPTGFWKSQATSLIATCYAPCLCQSNKSHKAGPQPFFIDICPSVSANEKQGTSHSSTI